MVFVVGTFVLVVGIVYGLYWLFVEREDAEHQQAIRKRLKKPTAKSVITAALLKEKDRLSDVGAFDTVLVNMGRITAPMQRTVSQSGLNVTVSTIILASLCVAGLTYIAVTAFLHLPLFGLAAAAFALFVPYSYVKMTRNRRMIKFEEQFPEAIDLLARALRAGHALTTGLSMVADEMSEPVGPEFRLLFDQQNFGMPLKECLLELADRVPLLDVRFFATAVTIQRETGGNLAEILDNLAYVVRERFKILRQVRVHTAHGRFTGYVLLALPAVLGIILSYLSPDHMNTLFTEPMGKTMLMGAGVMQTVGYFWIKQVIKIEV